MAGLVVKRESAAIYEHIMKHGSLVLTAVQQERQIQKWSNKLAVYCLGLSQGVNKKASFGPYGLETDILPPC